MYLLQRHAILDVRVSVVLVANEMWNVTMEKKIQRERKVFPKVHTFV